MAGTVWEWTSDWYVTRHADEKSCCGGPKINPRVTSSEKSYAVAREFGRTRYRSVRD
jgi:formylglycine-generating enzyme